MFACFFKPDRSDESNINGYGGPRSFHHFSFNSTTIILIGTNHRDMPANLERQYVQLFEDYLNDKNVILFLEKTKNRPPALDGSEQFLDALLLSSATAHLEFVFTEKRQFFNDDPIFYNLWFFIKRVTEAAKLSQFKVNPLLLFQSSILEAIAKDYEKSCTLQQLQNLLNEQVDYLTEMIKPYRDKIPDKLLKYFNNCLQQVSGSGQLLYQFSVLANDSISTGHNESLVSIALLLMKKNHSIEPVQRLAAICIQLLRYFHDATLLCDLWQKLSTNENQKQFLVIMGESHIRHLARLLKDIGKEVTSYAPKPCKNISYLQLENYLNAVERRLPANRNCQLM